MKYLLDTCTISEFTKPQGNSGVIEWLEKTDSDDLYLSVITIGEVKKGINNTPPPRKNKICYFGWKRCLKIIKAGFYPWI